jgi:UDP-glucuronate 4-epimerase
MKILVTGSAGFIGFHLVKRLCRQGHEVIGLDSVNDYYDVELKYARLRESGIERGSIGDGRFTASKNLSGYSFIRCRLEDRELLEKVFEDSKPDRVCNLAAQAGVRYSLTNPHAYIDSNVTGFLNILECCRRRPVSHLVYASSSSVYGLNASMPFSASDPVDHPVSLYAASKKSNELMAHAYSHLFKIPTTGLRFFTVYGPWGRPDMALFLFTSAILAGKPIDIFNNGEMRRDFTYVDDIVEGVARVIDNPPSTDQSWDGSRPDPASSSAPYRIYNIGNSSPVRLLDFIELIEEKLGKKAIRNYLPMQDGDVPATWADVEDLERDVGYRPSTPIRKGVGEFIDWYLDYYKVMGSRRFFANS